MDTNNKNKVLRLRDVTLYTVSAMLFMDQIALAASLGSTSLFWWAYVLVVLFIPMAMMTSELGTAFPDNGGVYHWVRTAFGFKWGARVSWMYWINNALWMPSVYILFAGMLSAFYFPELSLWAKIAIGVVLALFTAAVNALALRIGKWLPNIGAILKLIAVLGLGIGGISYGLREGFANPFTLEAMLPTSGHEIAALGIMVYGIMGTELACCSAAEMINPKRDIPRAVLISGVIIAAFNVFGTLGVLAAVPPDKTDVTQIFAGSLFAMYGHDGLGGLFANMIACFVLFTLFTNMVTWSMGTNRAAVAAAASGEFPALFGVVHPRHKTPIGSALMASLVSVVLMVVYGLVADSAEALFWTLLSIFAMIFMMPYVLMCLAFIKLRLTDPTPRPFRMPLGNRMACLWAAIVGLHVLAGIALFVVTPGEPISWGRTGQILIGVVLALLIGEAVIRLGGKPQTATVPVA
ncbi:APC family permease [Pseudomonas sp. R5(2019)]|uniref:APC family permease n=1 Tax=Pseudomonas sp. R5(2019) TaxID=2697566 RepID=UPI001411E817|nr:APC family permease [Pseudomonas sp. R5(2019)]NBA98268.1 amino acid permease [Pseudomonas sp. R5(2019)]